MNKTLKMVLHLLLIILIFLILVGLCYLFIQDVNATKCKDYAMNEYGLKKLDFIAYKVDEYVYNEDQNCGSLWFKKCTDDKNLVRKTYFITKDKKKFYVIEYEDGVFESNYE